MPPDKHTDAGLALKTGRFFSVRHALKKAIALAIVVFWALSMFWLVRYEVFPERFNIEPDKGYGAIFQDGLYFMDSWMQIYFNEEPIGFSRTWVDNQPGDKTEAYFVKNQTSLDIRVMGELHRVYIASTAALSEDYELSRFSFKMQSNLYETEIWGTRQSGNLYKVTVRTGGSEQITEIEIPDDVVIYSPATEMALSRLNPGRKMNIRTFDPVSMSVVNCAVEGLRREEMLFLDKQVEATVVKLSAHGMDTIAWIDDNGRVLRQETPFGWTMVATTAARVQMGETMVATRDILLDASVPCEGTIENARSSAKLVVELAGPGIAALVPETHRQSVKVLDENKVQITLLRETIPETSEIGRYPDTGMSEFLESTVYIQSDHHEIKELAVEIVGDSGTVMDSAVRIHDWVFKNIRKDTALSVPSALAVLKAGEGDCNEHAYLFAALARAAGIPTKVKVGIVYDNGRFLYHAWVSVFAGRWVEMDPTWGQKAVDATHIVFTEGELQNQMRIIAVMGRLEARIPEAVGSESVNQLGQ